MDQAGDMKHVCLGLEGPFEILWFSPATIRVWLSLAGGSPLTRVGVCVMSMSAGVGEAVIIKMGQTLSWGRGQWRGGGVNALEA